MSRTTNPVAVVAQGFLKLAPFSHKHQQAYWLQEAAAEVEVDLRSDLLDPRSRTGPPSLKLSK